MLSAISIILAVGAIIVLHKKAFMYYKAENPNKSILSGYITGRMVLYLLFSLFPILEEKKFKSDLVGKLNLQTYLFYLLFALTLLFVFLSSLPS